MHMIVNNKIATLCQESLYKVHHRISTGSNRLNRTNKQLNCTKWGGVAQSRFLSVLCPQLAVQFSRAPRSIILIGLSIKHVSCIISFSLSASIIGGPDSRCFVVCVFVCFVCVCVCVCVCIHVFCFCFCFCFLFFLLVTL